jgi:hypothetical protein
MATGADGMPAVCEETPFWCHHAQSYEKSIYSVAASNPPHTPLPCPVGGGGTNSPTPSRPFFCTPATAKNVHTHSHSQRELWKAMRIAETLFHISLVLFIFFHFLRQ